MSDICQKSHLKDDEQVIAELGKGAFGCTLRIDCGWQPLAVKIQKLRNEADVVDLENEILIQYLLSEEYHIFGVPRFYSFYQTQTLKKNILDKMQKKCLKKKKEWSEEKGEYGIFVSQLATDGNLSSHLAPFSKMLPDSLPFVATVFLLLFTLYQMHQAGCIHNDLKPDNIVLTRNGKYTNELVINVTPDWTKKAGGTQKDECIYFKIPLIELRPLIIDFGLAVMPFCAREKNTNASGTQVYMPPEILIPKTHVFDPQYLKVLQQTAASYLHHRAYGSDVYAMGLIILDMILGRPYYEFADLLFRYHPKHVARMNINGPEGSILNYLLVRYILDDSEYNFLLKNVFHKTDKDYLPLFPELVAAKKKLTKHPMQFMLLKMTSFNPWDRVDAYGGSDWTFFDPCFNSLRTNNKQTRVPRHGLYSNYIDLDAPLPALLSKNLEAQQNEWIEGHLAPRIKQDSKT